MMKKKRFIWLLAFLWSVTALMACGDSTASQEENEVPETEEPKEEDPIADRRMVVGYYPDWSMGWFKPDYAKLTHICLAFAQMKGDATVSYNAALLREATRQAHANGVKVLVSLRDNSNVSAALADDKLRAQLVKNTMSAVDDLGVDGVDVDYEEWGEWGSDKEPRRRNLEAFYVELRAALGDKLLTAAVGGKTQLDGELNADMLKHLDYVFPMIYDQCGGWEGGGWGTVGQHSSYEYFEDVIRFFTEELQVPKEKLCPGVPFYGYEFLSSTSTEGAKGIGYRDILSRYPDADKGDNQGLIWYNGPATLRQKAQSVVDKDLAGVMIWEISQDTDNAQKSLLNVLDQTLNGKK